MPSRTSPSARRAVRFTANFEQNLASIEAFWQENGHPAGYDRLLDELGETLIPNLERFPAMGKPFLPHRPDSVEAFARLEKIEKQLARISFNASLHEYLLEDYVVLYGVLADTVYLLAIKHHKQLSFDFIHLWPT